MYRPGLVMLFMTSEPPEMRRRRRQGHMTGNHAATTDDTLLAERHAAGNAGTTGQHAVGPDAAVVGDLDEVIDLAAVTDHRIVQRAAVDRRIGADFDIVANDDADRSAES